MDYSYWYEKWQNDKEFSVENDRLKPKKYIFTPFPKAVTFGFQEGKIREYISSDVIARYLRITDNNVLFPTGINSLCSESYVENKLHSGIINDDISNVFKEQMLKLGIGINNSKFIDMRHNEYLSILQNAFIELYNEGLISYKNIKVYYDKSTSKIYDNLNLKENLNLPLINHKCFTLNIKDVIPNIIDSIDHINTTEEIKNYLKEGLMPNTSLKMSLQVSNGEALDVKMNNYYALGGLSFILLNPDYIDIGNYISSYEAVEEFLSSNDERLLYAFSGSYALNPLTGKDIPIYIATIYNKDIHLGIPALDEDDLAFINDENLEYIEIFDKDILINSDFLNGKTKDEAAKLLASTFEEAEIASLDIKYQKEEINLSSVDNFGALFPFLEDKDTKEIKDLSGHLPYAFSSKLRPVLIDDVDIIGSTMNGTMNSLFVGGICPILAILYDEIGSITKILSKDAIEEYKSFGGIYTLIVNKDSLYSDVLMPLIIYSIIENKTERLPRLINNLIIIDNVVDESQREIKKSNTNIIDFDKLLSRFCPDSIRLYTIFNPTGEAMPIDFKAIENFDSLVDRFYRILTNPSIKDCQGLEYKLFEIKQRLNELKPINDLKEYACLIYALMNYISEASKRQILEIIKMIYPVMPFTAEDVYKKIFNGKYSVINEGWIK